MTRTLADYRPQHDYECEVFKCSTCGSRYCTLSSGHVFTKKPCSCGLDALITVSRRSEEETDQSRSDQPQLRAGEADLRDDQRDGFDDLSDALDGAARRRIAETEPRPSVGEAREHLNTQLRCMADEIRAWGTVVDAKVDDAIDALIVASALTERYRLQQGQCERGQPSPPRLTG
jgi:hypothetical protein